jgi:hypothetical protein
VKLSDRMGMTQTLDLCLVARQAFQTTSGSGFREKAICRNTFTYLVSLALKHVVDLENNLGYFLIRHGSMLYKQELRSMSIWLGQADSESAHSGGELTCIFRFILLLRERLSHNGMHFEGTVQANHVGRASSGFTTGRSGRAHNRTRE